MKTNTSDPAKGLPWLPAMQFASSATEYASLDRIYSERHTVPHGDPGTYPTFPTTTVRGVRFPVGQVHPKYDYAYVTQSYISSQDNEGENWTVLYRIDVQAYCAAAGLTFPDILSKDGYRKSDEYGDGNSTINWQFVVLNPDNYNPPALNTAHPDEATAVLVGQSLARDGIVGIVNRRYEKLGATSDWSFDEETGDPIQTTRQIVFATGQPTTPDPGTDKTRHELGNGFSLDITRTINGGDTVPTAYDYQHYIDFEFPKLLEDVEALILGGDYRFNMVERSAFVKKVAATVHVDFLTAAPSPSAIYQLYPRDWNYDGFGFDVHEQNIICDEWDFAVISSSSVEVFVGQASSPTYSDYLTDISGGPVLILERITRWRFNLWKREQVKITLE